VTFSIQERNLGCAVLRMFVSNLSQFFFYGIVNAAISPFSSAVESFENYYRLYRIEKKRMIQLGNAFSEFLGLMSLPLRSPFFQQCPFANRY